MFIKYKYVKTKKMLRYILIMLDEHNIKGMVIRSFECFAGDINQKMFVSVVDNINRSSL